jgi:hypothetical protein
MLDEMGTIIGRVNYNEIGQKRITYTWEGPPLALISRRYLPDVDDTGIFELGPWLLKIIDRQPWTDCVVVENIERPFAWVYTLRHKAHSTWEDFTWRMIHTLIIWGLARPPQPGAMVDWRLVKERWL